MEQVPPATDELGQHTVRPTLWNDNVKRLVVVRAGSVVRILLCVTLLPAADFLSLLPWLRQVEDSDSSSVHHRFGRAQFSVACMDARSARGLHLLNGQSAAGECVHSSRAFSVILELILKKLNGINWFSQQCS